MAPAREAPSHAPWWKRVGWLVVIWALSVAALGLVAWMLKGVMRAAGLSA